MLNTIHIKRVVYGAFSVFVIVYFLSTFLSPISTEALDTYNISEQQLRLITVTFLLPIVSIWTCAVYGFVHFKQYALSIKGSRPGSGTNTIANGIGIIALQLMASGAVSIMSSVQSVKQTLGGDKGMEFISTGTGIILALISTIFIYYGARQLIDSLQKNTKLKIFTKSFYVLMAIIVMYLASIIYEYPTNDASNSIYGYIPLWATVLFVSLPHIITWNLALLSVRSLFHYRKQVKGKVYQQTLGLLTTGLLLIISSSVLIQLLGTFSNIFSNFKIVPLLLVVYSLIIVIGIGYLYLAKAATKLRQVEN